MLTSGIYFKRKEETTMRYEKSESLELGKAEELVLVAPQVGSTEENPQRIDFTTNPAVAYMSEYNDEE
jgi:hypothetical protein